MKGRDLQQDSVAASTAKHQNAQSEITGTPYTARDAQVTRKEGISNNTRLQHPQQKPKTPSVKTQNKHVHRRKRGKEHDITPQNM